MPDPHRAPVPAILSTEKKARPSRASGRVTLSDVAQAAGVSPITVSRALRGERRVAPELVERVQAVAQQMGYVPDPAARALASQKSNQVLVLVPLLSNTLFVELLDAVHRELFPQGYQTLIGVTHYDPAEEEQLLRSYLPMRPAGLLLTGFERSLAAQALLDQGSVPCVHLMELGDGGTACTVGFSQAEAGAAMTRHLLARGYRRIAFCGAQLDARVMQRLSGYRSVLQAEGLYDPQRELLCPEHSSMALGAQLFMQIVQGMPAVDAIFFCNDDIAQGALLQANRSGIAVPGQVAIAGFNDLPGSDQMVPPLTTVRTPRGTIGTEASRLLLQLMRQQLPERRQLDLGYELLVRDST
ncbi:LacI family DNA-binding transcriptional regulator GntR [Comamonas humi]